MSTDVAAPAEPLTSTAPTTATEPSAPGRPASPAEPPVPLWRNWRFQLLWFGSGTALLGLGAADFAYPLVILLMTGSPAMAGLFGCVQMVASIGAGLPAGALVDRWDRRHTLIAAEVTRALVTGSVAAAWALGHLTVAHLLVVAGVLGAVSPFGGAARMLMVRAVVPTAQLTRALTQDEVRSAATGLAGPPLGGALLMVSRALPFLFCALTFLVSLCTALIVRVPARAEPADRQPAGASPAAAAGNGGGILAGLRELWANRTI